MASTTSKATGTPIRLTEWQVGILEWLVDRELTAEVARANDPEFAYSDPNYRLSLRALRNKLANI